MATVGHRPTAHFTAGSQAERCGRHAVDRQIKCVVPMDVNLKVSDYVCMLTIRMHNNKNQCVKCRHIWIGSSFIMNSSMSSIKLYSVCHLFSSSVSCRCNCVDWDIKIHLHLEANNDNDTISRNVVAEIRGSEFPNSVSMNIMTFLFECNVLETCDVG